MVELSPPPMVGEKFDGMLINFAGSSPNFFKKPFWFPTSFLLIVEKEALSQMIFFEKWAEKP